MSEDGSRGPECHDSGEKSKREYDFKMGKPINGVNSKEIMANVSSGSSLSDAKSILRGKIVDYESKDLNSIWKRLIAKDGVGDEIAVMTKDTSLTFREIDRKSNILASYLDQIISKPRANSHLDQRIVALFIPENEDRIATILAMIKLQVIYVPLDTTLPKDRVWNVICNSGASALLYQGDDYLRHIRELGDEVILIDVDMILDAVVSEAEVETDWEPGKKSHVHQAGVSQAVASQAVVCMLYTSGSTGSPRAVAIRQSSLINRLEWQWRTLPWTDTDIGCHKTSLLFVDSLTEILGCLFVGRPLVVVPRFILKDPDSFVDILHQTKVTRIILVPSLLQNIITYTDAEKLQNINSVVCSGEALPPTLAMTFLEQCPNTILVNLYGSTETTGDVTCMVFRRAADVVEGTHEGFLAVGQPLDNNEVYILNEQHEAVAPGEIGEIFLAGLNVTDCYVSDEDESWGCFVKNPFSTTFTTMYSPGDYGVLKNENIVYQGRKDCQTEVILKVVCMLGLQMKVRGHRVNLREIEKVLEEIPSIDDVSVLVCPCRSGSIVVAFYTTNTRCFPSRRSILLSIKQQLPSFMLPILIRLEAIPLQPQTGKVDRSALKRLYKELCEVTSYNLEDDLENNLEVDHYRLFLHVVANELGVPESLLEPSLGFSEVGGNSLAAVAAVLRLNDLGFKVKVSDLLGAQSLRALAESSERNPRANDLPIAADLLQDDLEGFEVVNLTDDVHKQEVITLMAEGFVEKNPLDVIAGTTKASFQRLMESIWEEVVQDGLSFYVVDKREILNPQEQGKVVAATISLDVRTNVQPHFDMEAVADINEAVERPVKEKLVCSKERWLDCLLNAVDPLLPDGLALSLLHRMETKLLELAAQRGYDGIVTVNSHPVTMAVAERVFNYRVENSLRVKSFIWNGSFPFKAAPESYCIKAMTKRISSKQ